MFGRRGKIRRRLNSTTPIGCCSGPRGGVICLKMHPPKQRSPAAKPGSIRRTGTHVQFVLIEQDQLLSVDYTGTEAPPDTFKDDSQALADGSFGRDGVFHAKALQAKCASKYAPKQPGGPANGTPSGEPAKNMTQAQPRNATGLPN